MLLLLSMFYFYYFALLLQFFVSFIVAIFTIVVIFVVIAIITIVVVALSAGVRCHHSPVKTELHCIHCLLTLPHCRLRFGLAARSVARDATLGLPFKMVKCLRL